MTALVEQLPVALVDQSRAFAHIYGEWFQAVRRWVHILGVARADNEDVVQDIFIVVHRRLADFDGRNVAGWLYQITRRRVRDYRRSAWITRFLRVGDISTMGESLTHDGPDAEIERREDARLLTQLLSSLNDEQRVAFVLFEIDARSGAEIAAIQGVSVSVVWVRIHRARERLRQLLRACGRIVPQRRPEES